MKYFVFQPIPAKPTVCFLAALAAAILLLLSRGSRGPAELPLPIAAEELAVSDVEQRISASFIETAPVESAEETSSKPAAELIPPLSPPAPSTIARGVQIAIDPARAYIERRLAIANLSADLEPANLAALILFLSQEISSKHPPADERALRNDVMNLLRNQETPVPGLTEVLAELFLNDELDVVVRDYAVQHLAASHPRAPAEDRALIQDILVAGLDARDSSIAGTALLGLRHLGPGNGIARDVLPGLAAEIAADPGASQLSRITALQVAADLDSAAITSAAAEIALDPRGSYPLRLSAIAALQRIESPEAERALAEVENWSDPHLAAAFR